MEISEIVQRLRQLDADAAALAAAITPLLQRGLHTPNIVASSEVLDARPSADVSGALHRARNAIGDLRHAIAGHPPSWNGGALAELAMALPPPAPPAELAVEIEPVEPEPIVVAPPKARRR
jgi:hypothetical protein